MQRNTVQRQIIFDTLQSLKHPTVLEVNAEIQKKHPTISKTTIYRNLRQLDQEGIICQFFIPGDAERYDNNPTPHYHLKCRHCGKIFDVDLDLHDLNNTIEQNYPFKVDRHDVVFTGICNAHL